MFNVHTSMSKHHYDPVSKCCTVYMSCSMCYHTRRLKEQWLYLDVGGGSESAECVLGEWVRPLFSEHGVSLGFFRGRSKQ